MELSLHYCRGKKTTAVLWLVLADYIVRKPLGQAAYPLIRAYGSMMSPRYKADPADSLIGL